MSQSIQVLPVELANQIAAGEVVERPSSVVKELVENSIDAGATRIRVDVEGGGIELLRVVDDGRGMSEADAALCLVRHATSKISQFDDLKNLGSFGFRGEALPSIASVSRCVVRTRMTGAPSGIEVHTEDGHPKSKPCGSAEGTVVEVRDLFFNVPARRKFLKSTATEAAHIAEVAEAIALCRPNLTLQLYRDGRLSKEWLRVASNEERVRAIYRSETLICCTGERGPVRVEAYLSGPERARSGAHWLSLLVNGRSVRDRGLSRAISLAYGSLLEPGRYPIGVVYIDITPQLVDVNVHPQKAEVRFQDARAVSDALMRIVSASISKQFNVPVSAGLGFNRFARADVAAEAPHPVAERLEVRGDAPDRSGDTSSPGFDFTFAPMANLRIADAHAMPPLGTYPPTESAPGFSVSTPSHSAVESRDPYGSMRFVAQVKNMFLIAEADNGLYILDQHAAAERVTFDRLRRGYQSRSLASQQLLFPAAITLSADEVALLERHRPSLERLGVDLQPLAATQVALRAVPALLSRMAPDRVVADLLDELTHDGERGFSNAVDRVLATLACHGSLRAGDPVSREEATALFASLSDVDFAGHCPHGRPILTRLPWPELERAVGRR